MIFYFSGTGNSLYVAENIAKKQNDRIISIAECVQQEKYEFTLNPEEKIGFSFPIYFFGIPSIVEEFIDNLSFKNYDKNYIYAVFNCGGSIGYTDKYLEKKLRKKRYSLSASFSVFMPDNYIILADLLTPSHEIPILLEETDKRLVSINEAITEKGKGSLTLHKKRWTWLESAISRPFYKNNRSTKPFHTTVDCTSCGLCADICPCKTISMQNGRPVWAKECTQCLACIHRCPEEAIQYGKKTYTRGRYLNPNVSF